ncbi:MAG: hypothetical protein ACI8RD_013026, partial [Bacillariaceae sp.]
RHYCYFVSKNPHTLTVTSRTGIDSIDLVQVSHVALQSYSRQVKSKNLGCCAPIVVKKQHGNEFGS